MQVFSHTSPFSWEQNSVIISPHSQLRLILSRVFTELILSVSKGGWRGDEVLARWAQLGAAGNDTLYISSLIPELLSVHLTPVILVCCLFSFHLQPSFLSSSGLYFCSCVLLNPAVVSLLLFPLHHFVSVFASSIAWFVIFLSSPPHLPLNLQHLLSSCCPLSPLRSTSSN